MTTPPTRIPMLDLQAEVTDLWDEITGAIHRVLRSGQFILGPEVEAFEAEAAAFLGVKHAIGLNSGTDALTIGLRALGVGPGDEVITTAFSFYATAETILLIGATPVFVDIRLDSYNLDPDLIEAAITERTRAIVPVHLYGNPAAMGRIMALAKKHDLRVLEDCAQSFGARYVGDSEGDVGAPPAEIVGKMTGAIGDAGAFSFYPTKTLGAYGDGGMLATNDDEVALLARKLRNHGSLTRYHNEMVGYNSRLDAIQAAVLRVKLPRVAGWNAARREVAGVYLRELAGCGGLALPGMTGGHVFHQFTVRVEDGGRDGVQERLRGAGIDSVVYYPRTLDELVGCGGDGLVRAREAAGGVVSLPLTPGMTEEDVSAVASAMTLSTVT